MTLSEFDTMPSGGQHEPTRPKHPQGWEPGVAWNGDSGVLTTAPLDTPPNDWGELLKVWDLDPAEFEVVEPVQYRAWDANVGNGLVKRMFYYRATVRRRRLTGPDIDELLAAIGKRRPRPGRKESGTTGTTLAVLFGDLQIGKPDGDGTDGTIGRYLHSLDAAVDRAKSLRRKGLAHIHLAYLGDCGEGTVSQGGALLARLDRNPTEQVRILRRLMLEAVKQLAPLAETMTAVVIPGNHDQTVRVNGTMATRYDDSWDVEAGVSVADALELAGGYDGVKFTFPARDELTVTLDVGGTVVGHAHGHQFARAPLKWWAGQAHGRQPVGDADLLLAGHLHHLHVEHTGGGKTFLQVPALDGGSTWFRHRSGEDTPAGAVTIELAGGGWNRLEVA